MTTYEFDPLADLPKNQPCFSVDKIDRLQAELKAANEDAERLANLLQAGLNLEFYNYTYVNDAIKLHLERVAK